jgi:ketosteroid isomerase-like protein
MIPITFRRTWYVRTCLVAVFLALTPGSSWSTSQGAELQSQMQETAQVPGAPSVHQDTNAEMQEEILKLEKDFGQAMIKNDAEAIGRFLATDWIIIDPDGGIIDREHFLGVVRSGALKHEAMSADEARVRIYRDAATVTALATSKGSYMGQQFTTVERTTDFFVKQGGRWQCVLTQLTRLTKK